MPHVSHLITRTTSQPLLEATTALPLLKQAKVHGSRQQHLCRQRILIL
jgi:hypothetical protein